MRPIRYLARDNRVTLRQHRRRSSYHGWNGELAYAMTPCAIGNRPKGKARDMGIKDLSQRGGALVRRAFDELSGAGLEEVIIKHAHDERAFHHQQAFDHYDGT